MLHPVFFCTHPSPVGELLLTWGGRALTGLYMDPHKWGPERGPDWREDAAPFAAAREQLDAYFAGELAEFDLPLAPEGTEFQRRVWDALRRIPYGKTVSYAELARMIGKSEAVRAVGAANGRNPISIIIPCHRVIGADGSLVGYGGGLERKRWLLQHEAVAAGSRLAV